MRYGPSYSMTGESTGNNKDTYTGVGMYGPYAPSGSSTSSPKTPMPVPLPPSDRKYGEYNHPFWGAMDKALNSRFTIEGASKGMGQAINNAGRTAGQAYRNVSEFFSQKGQGSAGQMAKDANRSVSGLMYPKWDGKVNPVAAPKTTRGDMTTLEYRQPITLGSDVQPLGDAGRTMTYMSRPSSISDAGYDKAPQSGIGMVRQAIDTSPMERAMGIPDQASTRPISVAIQSGPAQVSLKSAPKQGGPARPQPSAAPTYSGPMTPRSLAQQLAAMPNATGAQMAEDARTGALGQASGIPRSQFDNSVAQRALANEYVDGRMADRQFRDPRALSPQNRTGIANANVAAQAQQDQEYQDYRDQRLQGNANFQDARYAEAMERAVPGIVPTRDQIKLAERLQAQGRDVTPEMIAQKYYQDAQNRDDVRNANAQLPGYDSQGRSPLRQRAMAEREAARELSNQMKAEAQRGRFEAAYARRHGYAPNENAAMLMAMGQATQQNPSLAMRSFGEGTRDLGFNDMMRDNATTAADAQMNIAETEGDTRLGVARMDSDANRYVADTNADAMLGASKLRADTELATANIQAKVEGERNRITELFNKGQLSLKEAELEMERINAESDQAMKKAMFEEQMRTNNDNRLDKLRQYQLDLTREMQNSTQQQLMMTPEGRAAIYAQQARSQGLPESQVQARVGEITGSIPSAPDNFAPISESQELVDLFNEYRSVETTPSPEGFKQWLLTKNRYIDRKSAEDWNSLFGAANRNRLFTLGGPNWTRGGNWSPQEAQIVEDAPSIAGYSAVPSGVQPAQPNQIPQYNPNSLQDMFLQQEFERNQRELQRLSPLDEMARRNRAQ